MTTASEQQQTTTASPTKRTLTDQEKRELLARKRREKLLQRGDRFLKNPEAPLNATTSAPEQPTPSSPEQPTTIDEEQTSPSSSTTTTPKKSDVPSYLLSKLDENGDPHTPQTPKTPVEHSPKDTNTLELNQSSPSSPNLTSPIFNVFKSEIVRRRNALLTGNTTTSSSPLVDTQSLIPDEEVETETELLLKPKKDDHVSKWMTQLRFVLIVIFSTYSALYSCFVPCDTVSRSYLNHAQTAADDLHRNTCSDNSKSILNYNWSSFSINHLSTWPYLPPLVLFMTIQCVVLIPRLLRYITVKRNKNNNSWLDVVLIGLQVYVRLKRLVTEVCLFIFTYVMVVCVTQYFYLNDQNVAIKV
jgi:hypothetical protein